MRDPDLEARVRSAAADALNLPPGSLTDAVRLEEDLGIDENRAAWFLGVIQDDLDVRFPDDFLDGIETLGQFLRAVRLSLGA